MSESPVQMQNGPVFWVRWLLVMVPLMAWAMLAHSKRTTKIVLVWVVALVVIGLRCGLSPAVPT